MKIITLGPRGTYSHLAVQKFNKKAEVFFENTISEVLRIFKVKKNYDFAIVPFDNIIGGIVSETFDAMYDFDLKIYDSLDLEIHHCLASKKRKFDKICAHSQALVQCKNFISKKYPKIILQATDSNASAGILAQQDDKIAAILSYEGAKMYDLKIRHKNIEDFKGNKTKFWMIGKKANLKKGKFTSMMILPRCNRAGVLLKLLTPFNYLDISLTKLSSRPASGRAGEYIFYIECEGDIRDQKLQELLKILKTGDLIEELKIFGSYN
ncbi:hypothetical protein A2335_04080 [Candidatus Peregrinibacteria bacterium RIFOXYB2_FULL_32_7]|nr:MAG: hypothetical protein A2335_04080 [Candidatus Peregrinibacteria bacterium RIFOXYB2_FULL_32_7]